MIGSGTETLEDLVGLVAVATLPLGILAFVFAGWQLGVAVFVVGWLLLVPVFGIVTELRESRTESIGDEPSATSTTDPLETLRERYARGEIGESEFERRVDALLETDPDESASRVTDRDEGRPVEYET